MKHFANAFRAVVITIALLLSVLLIFLTSCQSKKKAMNIQKSATVTQSEVKKESSDSSRSSSILQSWKLDSSKFVTVEEWFYKDTIKNPLQYRKTVYQDNDVRIAETKRSDVKQASQSNVDSSGKSNIQIKSKVLTKDVKDNLTGKAMGIGFLILCVLAAVVWIWFQRKKAGLLKL